MNVTTTNEKTMTKVKKRILGCGFCIAAVSSACVNSEDRIGGETNFVRECRVREDCGPGERCGEDDTCEPGFPSTVPEATLYRADAGPGGPCDLGSEIVEFDPSVAALGGEWTGALAGDVQFRKVTLRLNDREPWSGSIHFGDEKVLPEADDPGAGYLVDSRALDDEPTALMLERVPVVEGFEYTLTAGVVRDGEVALTFVPTEPWNEWCALQTPYDVLPDSEDDHWTCTRNGTVSVGVRFDGVCTRMQRDEDYFEETGISRNDPDTAWDEDCGKMALCDLGVCQCTQEACAGYDSRQGFGTVLRFLLQDDRLFGFVACSATELNGMAMELDRAE